MIVDIVANRRRPRYWPRSGHIESRVWDVVENRYRGPNMNIARPLGSSELEKSLEVEIAGNIHELARGSSAVFRQNEGGEAETSTENLSGLLRRVAEASTREVDSLIGDLQALRRKLNTDGNRIQRELAEYTELSQQVMQLTNIISESVKKLPVASGINR